MASSEPVLCSGLTPNGVMAGWRPKAVARLRKSGSALDLLRDSVPQGTLAKNTLVTNG